MVKVSLFVNIIDNFDLGSHSRSSLFSPTSIRRTKCNRYWFPYTQHTIVFQPGFRQFYTGFPYNTTSSNFLGPLNDHILNVPKIPRLEKGWKTQQYRIKSLDKKISVEDICAEMQFGIKTLTCLFSILNKSNGKPITLTLIFSGQTAFYELNLRTLELSLLTRYTLGKSVGLAEVPLDRISPRTCSGSYPTLDKTIFARVAFLTCSQPNTKSVLESH